MSDPGSPRAAVVLLAAGDGSRVGAGTNKVLLPLAGLPVFAWSLRTLQDVAYVEQVVVVVRERDRDMVAAAYARSFPATTIAIVTGGRTRHGSEWNALRALADDIDTGRLDVVVVHDAARPLATADLFREVIEVAARHGGALPVREQRSLVARDPDPGAEPLTGLVAVQTPQGFAARMLLDAYRAADRDGFTGTDTASCVERYSDLPIRAVLSPATNLKITFAEDVALAERLLGRAGP